MTDEEIKELFRQHWGGYTAPLLEKAFNLTHLNEEELMDLIRFLCESHAVHFAKHERDKK